MTSPTLKENSSLHGRTSRKGEERQGGGALRGKESFFCLFCARNVLAENLCEVQMRKVSFSADIDITGGERFYVSGSRSASTMSTPNRSLVELALLIRLENFPFLQATQPCGF
jgi:hypothetical protein